MSKFSATLLKLDVSQQSTVTLLRSPPERRENDVVKRRENDAEPVAELLLTWRADRR